MTAVFFLDDTDDNANNDAIMWAPVRMLMPVIMPWCLVLVPAKDGDIILIMHIGLTSKLEK